MRSNSDFSRCEIQEGSALPKSTCGYNSYCVTYCSSSQARGPFQEFVADYT